MSGPYDDIIGLPHPTPPGRPRMSALDRAAQFSPFAALAGFEEAIRETARWTEERAELDETAKSALNQQLSLLADAAGRRPEASISYFLPDEKKSGGRYITVAGRIKTVDILGKRVIMEDGQSIPMEDILRIECAILRTAGPPSPAYEYGL